MAVTVAVAVAGVIFDHDDDDDDHDHDHDHDQHASLQLDSASIAAFKTAPLAYQSSIFCPKEKRERGRPLSRFEVSRNRAYLLASALKSSTGMRIP